METNHDVKLNIPKNCDNAPKRSAIRDFIIALYKKEWGTINKGLEDKFEFRIIGNSVIETEEELKKYLDGNSNVVELTLDEILSHGKFGACNGTLRSKNKEINFAYFFEFKSAGKNTIKIIAEYKIANS